MTKMKAVVLHGPENYPNNYEVMEIEKPVCGENEILLEPVQHLFSIRRKNAKFTN